MPMTPRDPAAGTLPLVVDLDGTLIDGDLLHLSLYRLALRHPLQLCLLPLWLWRGKAAFKHYVGEAIGWSLDVSQLNYRPALVTWLRSQRASGRHIVLATASPDIYAQRIVEHLGLFDEYFASNGSLNLSGQKKADVLVARFGQGNFVYAGDSFKDIPVWRVAAAAIPVCPSRSLRDYIEHHFAVETSFN